MKQFLLFQLCALAAILNDMINVIEDEFPEITNVPEWKEFKGGMQ